MACPRDSLAHSERVGSSAFDLMDCMDAETAGRSAKEWLRTPNARRGRGEQILHRQVGGGELRDHLAAIEYKRAVADLRHLLEIRRYDDDRRPCLERDVEQTIDFGLGPDVDAGGRILEDVNLRLEVQPAPDHHLLLVAARQELDWQRRIVRPQSDLGASLLRGAILAAWRDERK